MCTCVRCPVLTQEQVEQEVVMITASHLLPDLYIACSKFVRACEALLDWSEGFPIAARPQVFIPYLPDVCS